MGVSRKFPNCRINFHIELLLLPLLSSNMPSRNPSNVSSNARNISNSIRRGLPVVKTIKKTARNAKISFSKAMHQYYRSGLKDPNHHANQKLTKAQDETLKFMVMSAAAANLPFTANMITVTCEEVFQVYREISHHVKNLTFFLIRKFLCKSCKISHLGFRYWSVPITLPFPKKKLL